MKTRRLKERKEEDGANIEFKVQRTLENKTKVIKETTEKIVENIESGDYKYLVDDSKTEVEVVDGDSGKYLRSKPNDDKTDNIDDLPTYE